MEILNRVIKRGLPNRCHTHQNSNARIQSIAVSCKHFTHSATSQTQQEMCNIIYTWQLGIEREREKEKILTTSKINCLQQQKQS